jgi:hypothetical protein
LAQAIGATGTVTGVPSVDADIEACNALSGTARAQCWNALDHKIMEQVVPWVPCRWPNQVTLTSRAISNWEYDQFSADTAWSK